MRKVSIVVLVIQFFILTKSTQVLSQENRGYKIFQFPSNMNGDLSGGPLIDEQHPNQNLDWGPRAIILHPDFR